MFPDRRGLWYILGAVLAVILSGKPWGDFLGFVIASFIITLYFHVKKKVFFKKKDAINVAATASLAIFVFSLVMVYLFQSPSFPFSFSFLAERFVTRFAAIVLGIWVYNFFAIPGRKKSKKHPEPEKEHKPEKKPKQKKLSLMGRLLWVFIIIVVLLIVFPLFIYFLDEREFGGLNGSNGRNGGGGTEPTANYNIKFVSAEPLTCFWVPDGDLFADVAGAGSYRCQGAAVFDLGGLTLEEGTQLQLWARNDPFGLSSTKNFNKITISSAIKATTAKFVYDKVVSEWFESRRPPCPSGAMNGLTLEIFQYSTGAKKYQFAASIPIIC